MFHPDEEMVKKNNPMRNILSNGFRAGRQFHWTFVRTWMNVGVVINPQLAFGQVQLRVSLSLKYKRAQISHRQLTDLLTMTPTSV